MSDLWLVLGGKYIVLLVERRLKWFVPLWPCRQLHPSRPSSDVGGWWWVGGLLRQQYSVVGEEYRAMTRSDMATLHGWTNFALWAKKISRNIPAVSSVYWRPTTCPVRSSSSSSRPECHSSWTNRAYPAVLGVSSARGLTTARLPVYLGWWTFQFTFYCRLGGFCNNARPGRRGSTNNIS